MNETVLQIGVVLLLEPGAKKVTVPVGVGMETAEGRVMVAVKVGAEPPTQMVLDEVASETCTDGEVIDPERPIFCGPVMPIALLVKVTVSARLVG